MSRTWDIAGKYSHHDKKIIIFYAILISIIWHFVWGVIFNVDIDKKSFKNISVIKTVFLGDFLDRTLLKENLSSYSYRGEGCDRNISFMEKSCKNLEALPKNRYFDEIKQKEFFIEKKDKLDYAEIVLLSPLKIKTISSGKKELNLTGPLERRGILYSPEKPEIPQWIKDQGQFDIEYKIFVNKRGRVIFLEQLSSSGNTGIDLLAARFLRKLRFSNIEGDNNINYQWGIIKVKLDSTNDRS